MWFGHSWHTSSCVIYCQQFYVLEFFMITCTGLLFVAIWKGGLNNKNLFLTLLEVRKSMFKVSTNSVPAVGLLSDLETANCLLCSHMVEKDWSFLFLTLLIKPLFKSWSTTAMISSNTNYFPMAPLQIPSHWRLGLQHMNFEGTRLSP